MVEDHLSSDGPALPAGRRFGPGAGVLTTAFAATSALAIAANLSFSGLAPPVDSLSRERIQASVSTPMPETAPGSAVGSDNGMQASASSEPAQGEPLATLPLPSAPPMAGIETQTPFAEQAPAPPADAPPLPETALLVQTVPLPVPRPREFRGASVNEPSRRVGRQISRGANAAALPAPKEDDRSFFEKMFGIEPSKGPALAYAALDSKAIDTAPRNRLFPVPNPDARAATATYDISARIVTMPDGMKLEAHSGLGDSMDNPRHVDLRMRGSTPPGTYDLTEREQAFHGVRALRLTPVGGSAAVYNRTGLLAHTYLLGPSGASNGCVSFKDYEKFLQAYLRGEVQRLVVVTGHGQDVLPTMAEKMPPSPARSVRRSSSIKVATLP